jgi:hypothetical protein
MFGGKCRFGGRRSDLLRRPFVPSSPRGVTIRKRSGMLGEPAPIGPAPRKEHWWQRTGLSWRVL